MSYGKGSPGWVFCPFALFSCLGGAIPIFQGVRWLVTGHWYALPLSRALEWLGVYWVPLAESSNWAGVSNVLHWLFDLPTALCAIIVGVLWHVVFQTIALRLNSSIES